MQCSLRNYYLAIAPHIGVGGIHRQNGVVVSDGRAQQKRTILSQLQCQPAQKSSILVVYPKLTSAKWLDVAESVEDCESICLLQNPGADVDAMRRRANIKLVPDANDFLSHYSHASNGSSGLRLINRSYTLT